MVFEGKVILKLQESEQILERGDSVTVVAGTGRQWRNESDVWPRFWSFPWDHTTNRSVLRQTTHGPVAHPR